MRYFLLGLAIISLQTNLYGQLDFAEQHRMTHPLLEQLETKIQAGDFEQIKSVLIARDGKLIYEKYFNGAQVDTRHNSRSATKTMATLLTGIAIKKGFLESEKESIFNHLKPRHPIQNADTRKEGISIEDLLTMSSIAECDDNNSFSRGNEERMYIIEDWLQFYLDLPVFSFPFEPKPEEQSYGRAWHYCSAGAAALAEVVQGAIGSPLDEFARVQLLAPLGIEEYKLHYTPTGTLNTAGGSEYRSRDLLKFIQLFLQRGKWDGKEIMTGSWVEKATTPKASPWPGMEYGYLLWLKAYGKQKKYDSFAMSGNGGQKMVGIPELNMSIAITTTNYGNRNAHRYVDEIIGGYIVPAME